MGEANLRFARGDADTAIKMCMEVIRQDPGAPEPFQTLSTLYDEVGELEKSVQFAVIGAHLAPPDAEEWERLANMSLELDDPRQAASCYKKAIGTYELAQILVFLDFHPFKFTFKTREIKSYVRVTVKKFSQNYLMKLFVTQIVLNIYISFTISE